MKGSLRRIGFASVSLRTFIRNEIGEALSLALDLPLVRRKVSAI